MRVGCNLLWLVPGRWAGARPPPVHLLRTLAADPPADIELSLYGLDAFGDAYPELARAFPTRLVPLTGRLKPLRVAAENTWLPREVRGKVDLMHHMGGVVPLAPGAPQPGDPARPPALRHARQLRRPSGLPAALDPRTVRRARLVLTASEFVRRGVVERFGVPARAGAGHALGRRAALQRGQPGRGAGPLRLPRRWFVYPAFTWWHKDHALAVQAFATLAAREHDVVLVLTGGRGPGRAVRDGAGSTASACGGGCGAPG